MVLFPVNLYKCIISNKGEKITAVEWGAKEGE